MSLMVWGHRGHRYHRRQNDPVAHNPVPHENSLLAYKQALQAVHGVECDVVQSRLKTPYLVHDTLFNGMVQYELRRQLDEASAAWLQDRFIFNLTDDEIEALRLADGQPIPALRDLLALMRDYPDQYVNLELKGPHVTDITIRAVERAIHRGGLTPKQVIFSSYSIPALRGLRAGVGTRFRVSLSFLVASQPMAQMYPNWPLAEQQAYYVPFSIEALQRPDIVDIQPDFFNVDVTSMTLETLEAIHFFYPKARIILWCSGEGDPAVDTRLADLTETYLPSGKLFSVLSDYPMDLRVALERRGIALMTDEEEAHHQQKASRFSSLL